MKIDERGWVVRYLDWITNDVTNIFIGVLIAAFLFPMLFYYFGNLIGMLSIAILLIMGETLFLKTPYVFRRSDGKMADIFFFKIASIASALPVFEVGVIAACILRVLFQNPMPVAFGVLAITTIVAYLAINQWAFKRITARVPIKKEKKR